MGIRTRNTFFSVFAALACLAGTAHGQTPCVAFERAIEGCAMPGGEVVVSVTVSSTCGGSLTALGLRESIPAGWTFGGVTGGSSAPPALASAEGATGTVEFAWVDLPAFPATFSYTLDVPAGETAMRALTGVPVFREAAGEITGAMVSTDICFDAGGGEGEGEGEGEMDPSIPEITLIGESSIEISCGSTYTDEGATATDQEDGDLTASIVRSGFVDTQNTGTYVVTFNVNDSDGNQAPQVSRAVTVTDTVAPSITLLGSGFVTQACGSPYIELGANAVDICDGTLPVTINGEVDIFEPGTYQLIYAARDGAGLNASVTRTITVEDRTGPQITLNGDSPMMVECNTPYEEPGAIAIDACSGLEAQVSIENNNIDTGVEGTYTVRYRATDSNGFESAVTRQVIVADMAPPEITLLGNNPLVLDCGSVFVDPNAIAMDACEGEVTVSSDAFSLVDTSEANTVEVTYSARDSQGNTAFASRTVIVDGPSCTGGTNFCRINSLPMAQPSVSDGVATVRVPEGAGAQRILLSAMPVLSTVPECTTGNILVTYDVDGSVQVSQSASAGFPAVYFLGAGEYTVQVTAEVMESGSTLTETFTLNVAAAADADGNGILDAPFNALVQDGERWTTDRASNGREGTITMTTWSGPCDGAADDPLVVRVRNPENNSQQLSVEIDRNMLECGEQGIVTVALGERLDNFLSAGDAASVPAAPEGVATGAPFFDISIVTSSDGGASFAPVSAAQLSAHPVGFTLTGVTVADATTAGFVHYPTTPTANGSGSFDLTAGAGQWTALPAGDVTVDGSTLTGQAANLSLFAALGGVEIPVKEGGPSCSPSGSGHGGGLLDLLCMAAVLLALLATGRRRPSVS